MPVAMALIAAAVLLFAGLSNMHITYEGAESGKKKPASSEKKVPAEEDLPMNSFDQEVPWQNQSILGYSRSSIEHQALNTSYGTCYAPARPVIGNSGAEIDNSVDSNLALLSQQRQRDKKRSDGWALKDADYFRHNYDWELDDYENKPWWGRSEY